MMQLLSDQLSEKRWDYKNEHYSTYFEYVENIAVVEEPVISIIIVSWRFIEDIEENLEHLLLQRERTKFEIIFVDNGSNPGSFDHLKKYIDTYVRLNHNTGAWLSRNLGAAFAKGPLLLFLDDDCIPDTHLVESHIALHNRYDIVAVRGASFFKTENPLNYKQTHYYLGKNAFPIFSDLEGNSSYRSDVFFELGGWSDSIEFGGGGKELAIRIHNKYPMFSKQIYSPLCLIFHDYTESPEHLENKWKKQEHSRTILRSIHENWDVFHMLWIGMTGDSSYLVERDNWLENQELINTFKQLETSIYSENAKWFNDVNQNYKINKNNRPLMQQCLMESQKKEKQIGIFGTGSLSEKLTKLFNEFDCKPSFYTDNNAEKWNITHNGLPVLAPSQLNNDQFIFIASTWRDSISLQLEELGFKKLEDYIVIY